MEDLLFRKDYIDDDPSEASLIAPKMESMRIDLPAAVDWRAQGLHNYTEEPGYLPDMLNLRHCECAGRTAG